MFTGIIEEKGQVKKPGKSLYIRAGKVLDGLKIGGSIAVNGTCLTAISIEKDGFSAQVSSESSRLTNLGNLRTGDLVNLERPLKPTDFLSGHIVLGHIDGLAELLEIKRELFWFSIPPSLKRYFVKKGSVAIDGVSLTICNLSESRFSVSIIPHSLKETTFEKMKPGHKANIETDYLAKIVERILGSREEGMENLLKKEGFGNSRLLDSL
ncbi:MAG: riboflavin synthase [bacterium]|nr:riboflavin synthase [bacterium]